MTAITTTTTTTTTRTSKQNWKEVDKMGEREERKPDHINHDDDEGTRRNI